MTLNPPTQYADDGNLRARQRLWRYQDPPFDLVGWVLEVAGVDDGHRVLDVGCGNGAYLVALSSRGINAVGCDLSLGMLRSAAPHPRLANGDIRQLPFRTGAFDVVLAPHMLYHVDDREAAARELRRVLIPGGRCVAVTNGEDHMQTLRRLIERAVRKGNPEWELQAPSTHAFSLENGADQLSVAFDTVRVERPDGVAPVVLRDPSVAADYVASIGDHYGPEINRPWQAVVADVTEAVTTQIASGGAFAVQGVTGALVCS